MTGFERRRSDASGSPADRSDHGERMPGRTTLTMGLPAPAAAGAPVQMRAGSEPAGVDRVSSTAAGAPPSGDRIQRLFGRHDATGARPAGAGGVVQRMWNGEPSSSVPHQDADVYLSGDLVGKNIKFTLTSQHIEDTTEFHKDAREALLSKVSRFPGPIEEIAFAIWWGPHQIPPAGSWPSEVPHRSETNFTIKVTRKVESIDKKLLRLVEGLDPDAVVPCSHIDDTHAQAKDREVITQVPRRVLSVAEITTQQRLERVTDALRDNQKFSLVLIDPSFGPEGDQTIMIQIVEYLENHHKPPYRFEQRRGARHSTTFTCDKVTITYIGVAVNSATSNALPNRDL